MKKVLLTGPYGRVGTAIIDHLSEKTEYKFTYLDRRDHEEHETFVADIADYDAIRPAFDGHDVVIHLAGYPETDGTWEEILENNIIGTYNVLEAAASASVRQFIFASSIHAVGMYENENKPEIYRPDFDLIVDHTAPHRPDSYYGASKCYGEDLGRYYLENYSHPTQFLALRICSVRSAEFDHPYGDAELGVIQGRWDRGSEQYRRAADRLKATWQSRRDFADLVDRCLRSDEPDFDIFYGISDNDRRWVDIEHARETIGYEPQDNGEEWGEPPR